MNRRRNRLRRHRIYPLHPTHPAPPPKKSNPKKLNPMPTRADEEVEDQEELSGQMSFLDHLEELRRRILNILIAVAVSFCITYWFADELFGLFSRLILNAGGQLNQTKLTEAFTLQLKLALMAAIFLAAPFILAQVWLFISPGLYRHERRYALPFIFFSSLLFIIGGLFGYFIALPFAIPF